MPIALVVPQPKVFTAEEIRVACHVDYPEHSPKFSIGDVVSSKSWLDPSVVLAGVVTGVYVRRGAAIPSYQYTVKLYGSGSYEGFVEEELEIVT